MKSVAVSIRNKLMLACALFAAGVLAMPVAMARDYYRGHDNSADVLGALVVGAVIGGVLVSASQHRHDYYYGGGYYPGAYAPPGYYGGYPSYSYPSYSYGNGGYYSPGYGYGSSVNVGVVYSRGANRYYGGPRGYGYYGNRGHGYYGNRGVGYYGGQRGHYDDRAYRGGRHDYGNGRQGNYYTRHGE